MGVTDKLLNFMHLNNEEDDYYDDYYYYEGEVIENTVRNPAPAMRDNNYDEPNEKPSRRTSQKVTPIRPAKKVQGSGMEVCVIKPSSVEDAREITETLLDNRAVVLNLEGLNL